jgi:hypothetical protein
MGHLISRQHVGWQEMIAPWAHPGGLLTEQRWIAEPAGFLRPAAEPYVGLAAPYGGKTFALPVIHVPTVVLVNRVSYPMLEHALDALQRPERFAVVLERTGEPMEGGQVVLYADGVRLHLNASVLVGRSGALGACADAVKDSISNSEISVVAEAVLARGPHACVGRPRYDYAMHFSPPVRSDTARQTRDQRLYGLFKVYAVLTRLYPDASITASWPSRLPNWIARADRAETAREYSDVLQEMAVTLRDAHASVSGVGGYDFRRDSVRFSIPARLARVSGGRTVVVQIVRVDDPTAPDGRSLAKNPFKVGDEVIGVDGKTIDEIVRAATPHISASNASHLERELSEGGWLGTIGTLNSVAHVQVRNPDGSTRDVAVGRSHPFGWGIHALFTAVPQSRILDGNIGYVSLGALTSPSQFDSIKHAMRNVAGLVIDNRLWRPGVVDYDLVRGWLWPTPDSLLSNASEIPVADFSGESLNVGRVRQTYLPMTPANYNESGEYYTKPIVVLIGPGQSEAEVVPIAVRNLHRGLLVGQRLGRRETAIPFRCPVEGVSTFPRTSFSTPMARCTTTSACCRIFP